LIVIDSSAVIEVLLRSQIGMEIEERILSPFENLCAPHLLDLEIAQVLRRYCASGDMSPERGQNALDDLKDMPITRYPHDIFLSRIWELRNNITAYDAAYVALAEALPAPLFTCDKRLASAPLNDVSIELFNKYPD
jgi:predicted nucleic acid-binding protein